MPGLHHPYEVIPNSGRFTPLMDRTTFIRNLDTTAEWDLIIVGGGATGVGIAIDSAVRGYRTLLLEQHDFGKGTSSRSTKLVHGGVRYLQQGNVPLVMEALRERGRMLRNAPHLVHDMEFVIPCYRWWDALFYGVGLTMYDLLAGRYSFGRSKILGRQTTLNRIPNIESQGLHAGVLYHDGQFDDARLLINMVQTAAEHGATLLNYSRVTGLLRNGSRISGVQVLDLESSRTFEASGKVVINATGPFTDSVRNMDDPKAPPLVRPSQGIHLVLDRSFLPGNSAIMIPKTDDGRVLFAIPWRDCVVIGTTDTPIEEASFEPRPLPEEVKFLLDHSARYLSRDPHIEDVLSVFVGIRPLVTAQGTRNTSKLSRDHTIQIADSGLITVTGGKWTTYRHMAQDVVNQAATAAKLEPRECGTENLPIHGATSDADQFGRLACYGSDAKAIRQLIESDPRLAQKLHPEREDTAAEVVWAARAEMARTVEDVLSRRIRALLLGAKISIEMAPAVARILAKELGHDESWIQQQIAEYTQLAQGYMLSPATEHRDGLTGKSAA